MRDNLSFSGIQATRRAPDVYCFSCEVAAWLVRLMIAVVHKNVSRQIGIAAGHQAKIIKGKTAITVYSPAPVCLVVDIWSRANGISRISFASYVLTKFIILQRSTHILTNPQLPVAWDFQVNIERASYLVQRRWLHLQHLSDYSKHVVWKILCTAYCWQPWPFVTYHAQSGRWKSVDGSWIELNVDWR